MFSSSFSSDMNLFKECMDLSLPVSAAKNEWNPYQAMGGTCAALSGPDFVVFAGDTRMCLWDSILTRDCDKIHVLDNNILLGTCGFYGDVLQLKKILHLRQKKYKFNYQHEMSVDMCSNMLARILYSRRFFPFYTGSILGGINTKGEGVVYHFDPIGHFSRSTTTCTGSGGSILQTFLDVNYEQVTMDEKKRKNFTVEEAKIMLRDAFRSLTERETSTGDKIKVVWLEAGDKKPHFETFKLRED